MAEKKRSGNKAGKQKKPLHGAQLWVVIVLSVLMVVCLLITLYPLISRWESNRSKIRSQMEYNDAIAVLEEDDSEALEQKRKDALEYNQKLYTGELNYGLAEQLIEEGHYFDQLAVNESGIIARVSIPCIDVELPIYHTDDAKVLQFGAGHLMNTSLPIGGENSHSVISAHSGMAKEPMFSNLTEMKLDDLFYITVLGETHAYKVVNIKTVLPEDVSDIIIQEGRDLVTLITCTPYGVNTHRLLVTGERTEMPTIINEDGEEVSVTEPITGRTDVWLEHYVKALGVGLGAVLVLIGLFLVGYKLYQRKHKKSAKKKIVLSIKMDD